MTTTEHDLQRFNEFARQRLDLSDNQPSLIELMDLWQIEHPTDGQHAENVAAVNAAISDFKNGDRGRRAGSLGQELRPGPSGE
jgi:hypothetical protein